MEDKSQMEKAIKIAFIDGFTQLSTSQWYVGKHKSQQVTHSRESLLDLYTTDLNYLMPIAVKVLRDLAIITDPFDTDQYEKFDTWVKLNNAIIALSLDPNNNYTELFNCLYEAVNLLNND
jgi:hypothetical protein